MTFRKGTEKQTMVSAGPITKYADDLTPVIKAFLGLEKSLELKIDQEVSIYYLILQKNSKMNNLIHYFDVFFFRLICPV